MQGRETAWGQDEGVVHLKVWLTAEERRKVRGPDNPPIPTDMAWVEAELRVTPSNTPNTMDHSWDARA